MVISIALLGFGAAGTFLSLFKKKLLERIEVILPILIIITSLLMAISVSLSQTDFFYFDSYKLFADFSHLWRLVATYLIFLLPFFFGALAIGLVFVRFVEKIGVLYFANMLGSGIGGIMIVFLMWIFFPEKLSAVIATIAFLAGMIVIPKQLIPKFAIVIAIVAAVLSFIYISSPSLKFSEYKSISKTLNLPETKVSAKKASPYGLLQIIMSSFLRYAPGLSISYNHQVIVTNAIFNNGDWLGPLVLSSKDSSDYFKYSTVHLPYIIGERKNILVLNAGTGRQVRHALLQNPESITAVEPNKALLSLLADDYTNMSDAFESTSLMFIKNIYPRTYLLSTRSKFDLITLPFIDVFGGTSGMYALQEQYLLTKEAFREMYLKLDEDGVISISTWIDYPYKNPLKIVATITEMLNDERIKNIATHIVAIKNWNTFTVLVKRNPLNSEEIKRIISFCKEMKFDPVILPNIKEDERDFYNKLQDKSFYKYLDKILSSPKEREEFYSVYPFSIKPATDERPYYSQFLQWNSIPQLSETFGTQFVPFFEVGYILLYLTFFQILLFAVILIILPLFKIGWKGNNKIRTIMYFAGLGLGYMFIEIVLIQRFTLYFGNVIYAASLVVCLMLVSSGFGSLFSQWLNPKSYRINVIIFIIVVSLFLYSLYLSDWLKGTIGFSLTAKILISFLIIAIPAFFMGQPFPLGLRLLSTRSELQIPWAWGINGVFSVIGAVLAIIIAVELGFTWVILFAAAAYCISLIANFRLNF